MRVCAQPVDAEGRRQGLEANVYGVQEMSLCQVPARKNDYGFRFRFKRKGIESEIPGEVELIQPEAAIVQRNTKANMCLKRINNCLPMSIVGRYFVDHRLVHVMQII